MVEQKTTKEILSDAIGSFDVFTSIKEDLIFINQDLDNQVWFRKDENNPQISLRELRTFLFKVRDDKNIVLHIGNREYRRGVEDVLTMFNNRFFDCSLAPETKEKKEKVKRNG